MNINEQHLAQLTKYANLIKQDDLHIVFFNFLKGNSLVPVRSAESSKKNSVH